MEVSAPSSSHRQAIFTAVATTTATATTTANAANAANADANANANDANATNANANAAKACTASTRTQLSARFVGLFAHTACSFALPTPAVSSSKRTNLILNCMILPETGAL